ncbi:small conductance mechanosensitive channel [Pararhizobium capsulatum DSM 1112]|uniref:Small-conductance mechanosensitive channel n=1 Tax=Pararhizobium capsulatum DSM 1112 TaxID=1121113 RepID=A0ABU0BPP4_9HYPH|nr:mechanosensitive ion channel domain-containing protein [Pararhizobium capsulatum]MDQ0319719.1 small conductance mechanosensitive channel [Pararhizobium capsulatum DSM 1112]
MEQQATDVIIATRTALSQASALAVQYSFSVIGAVLLLLLGWAISRLLHNWACSGLSCIKGIDETLARFFSSIIRYVVLILVFITVLGQFGVQTASIIAALGAIGLALQGTLQNIAAGIMLLVLRPFRVGESIETPAVSGTVTEVGLFATELRTADGLYRLAPNSILWNVPVTNYSRERVRRHDLAVVVGNSVDMEAAKAQLIEMANADQRVEQTPPPSAFISELGTDTTTLTLRYWVPTGNWWATTRDMLERTRRTFYTVVPDNAAPLEELV